MELCKGWAKCPLTLNKNELYHPEQLVSKLTPSSPLSLSGLRSPNPPAYVLTKQPVWICLEGQYVRLESEAEVLLACKLMCIYHSNYCCDNETTHYDTE